MDIFDPTSSTMTEPLAYLNSAYLSQSHATLSLHDAGFVMGATVTDLCRTFRHCCFRLADHLTRFRQSCDRAEIPQPRTDEELTAIAEELIAHNSRLILPEADLALVFFATPGPIGYYLGEPGGPGDGPPTFGAHTFPLPFLRYRSLFTTGAKLVVPGVHAHSTETIDPRIKNRSRLHWWLADRAARRAAPDSSALLQDVDGHLTETAAANFLIVRDGTVLSPPSGAILDGVSLGVVEELCAERAIPFARAPLTLTDALSADEAMLTSTPYCIAGVSSLDGYTLPWPGPIFTRLLSAWSDRVGLSIDRQILTGR
jgi:branched-chain amino acid aminotransferase